MAKKYLTIASLIAGPVGLVTVFFMVLQMSCKGDREPSAASSTGEHEISAASSTSSEFRLPDETFTTRLSTDHADICRLAWSHDGQYLAAGTGDGSVIVWNLQDPSKPISQKTLDSDMITSVDFSRDGRFCAAGSYY